MKQVNTVLTALLWILVSASVALAQQYGGATTLQSALEHNRTNQVSTWVNPDTGSSGSVVPVRTFTDTSGQPCREFQQTIVVAGQPQQGYGTACRQPDGNWRIVAGAPVMTAAAVGAPTTTTTVHVREVVRPYPYYPSHAYPYGYYDPYWYGLPFNVSLSLGYVHFSGKHFKGGHRGHHRGAFFKGGTHKDFRGFSHRGGHHKGVFFRGDSHRQFRDSHRHFKDFKGFRGHRGGGFHRR